MSTNDGGPAFPRRYDDAVRDFVATQGMSKRDYFAAASLPQLVYVGEDGCRRDPQDIADDAYRIADAMLKERDK